MAYKRDGEKITVKNNPLHPHLLDILKSPASEGLILGGGYGLQLKRQHVKGKKTLLQSIPEVRATMDLDFFLRLELFMDPERERGVRELLDSLNYRPKANHFLFEKPLGEEYPDRFAKVDLLAREPTSSEPNLKLKPPRVGSRSKDVNLHGRHTPEAFAVEESTIKILVNEEPTLHVHVPHPFSWLVMKTVAAGDWLKTRGTGQAKPNSEKHAYDCYILTGMITEDELESCREFNDRYKGHAKLQEARELGRHLFCESTSPGYLEACKRANVDLEFEVFWEGYQLIMGL